MKSKHVNIPIFLPELACPHQCIFCNQRDISGTYSLPNEAEIHSIIESHLKTIPKDYTIEIAFFGGNFTGIPLSEQTKYLNIAQTYINEKKVHGIRFSTRPDYINKSILERLKNYTISEIELGAQSFNDETLRIAERGVSSNDIRKAAKLIKTNSFNLGLQMMIGLPNDSLENAINTAKNIVELQANSTRIYPTLVFKNTKLAKYFLDKSYTALSLQEAIDYCAEIYPIFVKNNVKVLRIGLHPNEDFEDKNLVLAGPYHPSFKELVLTQIWKNKFNKKIPTKKGKLKILVNPSDINYAVGYNSANKEYLKNKYGWIQIIPDSNIAPNEFTYSYN